MPRKRTTRGQAVARPNVTSVNAKTMSQQELKAKADQLKVIISDYKVKVAQDMKRMEREQKSLELFIKRTFKDAIDKLPLDIKKLTMKEYAMSLSNGQTGSTIGQSTISKTDKLAEIQKFEWTNSSDGGLDTLEEEDESSESRRTAKTPSTKKVKKGKRGKSTVKPPASTRSKIKSTLRPPSTRVTRSQLYTPAGITREQWGATPLFTPKFDPNIPVTPANVREIKVGEITVSAAGSPVGPGKRRDFGVSNLSPRTMNKCATIIDQETEVPLEDRMKRIFEVFASALNQD